jgi:hypothetical protein
VSLRSVQGDKRFHDTGVSAGIWAASGTDMSSQLSVVLEHHKAISRLIAGSTILTNAVAHHAVQISIMTLCVRRSSAGVEQRLFTSKIERCCAV